MPRIPTGPTKSAPKPQIRPKALEPVSDPKPVYKIDPVVARRFAAEMREETAKRLAKQLGINYHDHRPFLCSDIDDQIFLEQVMARAAGRDPLLVDRTNVLQIYAARCSGKSEGSAPAIEVQNDIGATVAKTASGKAMIEGVTHTKFFLWAGAQGWSPKEVQEALKTLGLEERSILSIRTFVYAGRGQVNGMAAQNRGPIPQFGPEQVSRLNAARPAKEAVK